MKIRKLAHIINPVVVGESSDLFIAQPITFETMRIAQTFAKGQVEVALYSAQYPEDRPLVPKHIHLTPDLTRSVLDLGTFQKKRKLPLIKDILDRLVEATDADVLIYTNVDIALQPHFYLAVEQLIEQGYDAFIINRRTIPKTFQHLSEACPDRFAGRIALMYAQVGKPHPGHDCFVFKRSAYPHYKLGHTCIGTSRIGAVLALNLVYNATQFKEFTDLHLTFHIGNDKVWKSKQFIDYLQHNDAQYRQILAHYQAISPGFSHPFVKMLVRRFAKPTLKQKIGARLRGLIG